MKTFDELLNSKLITWKTIEDWYYYYGFFTTIENMEEIIQEWRFPERLWAAIHRKVI